MKKPILITGGKGLVGSKFISLFADTYNFEPLDISDPVKPVDITDEKQVMSMFTQSQAQSIIHLAAYTDVTGAWEQRGDTDGAAYKVNVIGTQNIINAAVATGKHVIHISTAYVFDGLKTTLYHEDDMVNPIEWYGYTKAKAEEVVMAAQCATTVLRIDQPFRSDSFPRDDMLRKIVKNITSAAPYPLFIDHFIGPTFIDDFAKVLDWSIRTKTTGLFHASCGEKISDYEVGTLIDSIHKLDGKLQQGTLDSYLKKLNRPYQQNTAMDIGKLKSVIDFELTDLATAIANVQL